MSTSPLYSDLKNITVDAVVRIFSGNKALKRQDHPNLVILVGSPGVGKTTQARRLLGEITGVDYDKYYNISLDSLVERIQPYRDLTKELYEMIHNKREKQGLEMLDKNTSLLSQAYLTLIMSKNPDFSIPAIRSTISTKVGELKDTNKDRTYNNSISNVNFASNNINTLTSAFKRVNIRNRNTTRKANSGKRNTLKKVNTTLKSLNELRQEGLKEGIKRGYNILYDTTLTTKSDKIKRDMMPLLESAKDKYKIYVVHVMPIDVKTVRERTKGRHNAMLKEGYIRAVNLTKTKDFVIDNKKGYDKAYKYYKQVKNNNKTEYQESVPDSKYGPSDFVFEEVVN